MCRRPSSSNVMVPAKLAEMANTPIGANLTIKRAIFVRALLRMERGWIKLCLSFNPMRATPTAMLNTTTAGMMLSAIERIGLEGMKRFK
ncbi:hypothetical protein ES703_103764 [subsurface metagenome]